jgi:hypothetical protein
MGAITARREQARLLTTSPVLLREVQSCSAKTSTLSPRAIVVPFAGIRAGSAYADRPKRTWSVLAFKLVDPIVPRTLSDPILDIRPRAGQATALART